MEVFETTSTSETHALGVRLGQKARPGDVYALDGDLGTGKTVLTQGIAQGLGIDRPVTSPTFTILQVHEGGRLPLYHFDAYRLEDVSELYEIGGDEVLDGTGVCVVEWAERILEALPPHTVRIRLEYMPARGPEVRRVTIDGSNREEA